MDTIPPIIFILVLILLQFVIPQVYRCRIRPMEVAVWAAIIALQKQSSTSPLSSPAFHIINLLLCAGFLAVHWNQLGRELSRLIPGDGNYRRLRFGFGGVAVAFLLPVKDLLPPGLALIASGCCLLVLSVLLISV